MQAPAMKPGRSKKKPLKQMASFLLLTNVVLHEDKGFFCSIGVVGSKGKEGNRRIIIQ